MEDRGESSTRKCELDFKQWIRARPFYGGMSNYGSRQSARAGTYEHSGAEEQSILRDIQLFCGDVAMDMNRTAEVQWRRVVPVRQKISNLLECTISLRDRPRGRF